MQSKTSFILVLIGVIIGFISSLGVFFLNFFVLKSFSQSPLNVGYVNYDALMKWNLIASIIGFCLSIILIFYVLKLARYPTKIDFIVTTVLGGLGFFLGMGLGGILVVIGGIGGIVKSNEPELIS